VNAEPSDDDLASDSGAGRTTPGQRASTRRATTRRAAATEPVSADAASAEPRAEQTRSLPTSGALPSTPAEVPAFPTPADPPTTELRGTVPGGAEPATATHPAAPVPTNIYRARRPGVAILLIIPAVAVGVLLVRALVSAALDDPVGLAGIIASVCALVSLPFLVAGVYGLVSGAAHGAEHYGFRVWARPPLAYLLVGLAFVTAAGLAAG
jgi:hypothetical protein